MPRFFHPCVSTAAAVLPRPAQAGRYCGAAWSHRLAAGWITVWVVGEGDCCADAFADGLAVYLEAAAHGHDDLQPVLSDSGGILRQDQRQRGAAVPYRHRDGPFADLKGQQTRAGGVFVGVGHQFGHHQLDDPDRPLRHRQAVHGLQGLQEVQGCVPGFADLRGALHQSGDRRRRARQILPAVMLLSQIHMFRLTAEALLLRLVCPGSTAVSLVGTAVSPVAPDGVDGSLDPVKSGPFTAPDVVAALPPTDAA